MKKTVIISGSNIIAGCMEKKIVHSHESRLCQTISNPTGDELQMIATENIDTVIYFPGFQTVNGMRPDLAESKTVFSACSCASISRLVLISSSAIYGASPANPGLMRESRKIFNEDKTSVQGNWLELEKRAEEYSIANQSVKCTILRSSPVLVRDGEDVFSRFFRRQFAFTVSLRDPSIQLLCINDLVEAVSRVMKKNA
ncbi:MAG: hypothetical protein GY781_22145, partial [Gammaproteobacteria bacterium]|nr:hypothetical protein [Gammaproteobacteria bacterium]